MIYEVRTYDLKPGTVAQYEENFGNALKHREQYSKARGILAHGDRAAEPDHPRLAL